MTNRAERLWQALDDMTRRFPRFYEPDVVNQLMARRGDLANEKMALAALAEMVDRIFEGYKLRLRTSVSENDIEDDHASLPDNSEILASLLDIPTMPEVVDAVSILAEFGLIELRPSRTASLDDEALDRHVQLLEGVLLASSSADPTTLFALMGHFRLAEWTEAGKTFVVENMGRWEAWEQQIAAEAKGNQQVTARLIRLTNEIAIGASALVVCFLYAWIVHVKIR